MLITNIMENSCKDWKTKIQVIHRYYIIYTCKIDALIRRKGAVRTYDMFHVGAFSSLSGKDTDSIAYGKLSGTIVVGYAT